MVLGGGGEGCCVVLRQNVGFFRFAAVQVVNIFFRSGLMVSRRGEGCGVVFSKHVRFLRFVAVQVGEVLVDLPAGGAQAVACFVVCRGADPYCLYCTHFCSVKCYPGRMYMQSNRR